MSVLSPLDCVDVSLVSKKDIYMAASFMQDKLPYLARTPLEESQELSQFIATTFGIQCHIYLKREDKQPNRSFKGRGAGYNIAKQHDRGFKTVVCASAGNHSQGVAMAVKHFGMEGIIFMPRKTPINKVLRTLSFGGEEIDKVKLKADMVSALPHLILHNGPLTIELIGENFDVACQFAQQHAKTIHAAFIHPFDDKETIVGQGTIGLEIHDQMNEMNITPDVVLASVGGGGLVAGMVSFLQDQREQTKVIGVEAKEAAAMVYALLRGPGNLAPLVSIDATVDGAAVKCAGELTSQIFHRFQTPVMTVDNKQIEYGFARLYEMGIIAELAGVLPFAALCRLAQEKQIEEGQHIVLVLSGSNIDASRVEKIIRTAPGTFPEDAFPLDYDVSRPFLGDKMHPILEGAE